MKRILLRLFVSLALSAVSVVGAVAQNVFEGVISFDKVEHNFGDILISSGPKECTFTFKNVGKGPIAVYRVLLRAVSQGRLRLFSIMTRDLILLIRL